MDLMIFGANGPTGRLLTRQALDAGHRVTAFTRHPDAFPLAGDGLSVRAGDVLDPAAVADAVKGHDAVVSVLGAPFGRQPVEVYSSGVDHVLAGMATHGVDRLVCVTSSTMHPSPQQEGGVVFRRVVQPFVTGVLGRTVYDDMRRLEARVRASDAAWTLVRPSGLFTAGAVGDFTVGEDHVPGRFTAREDLAACLLDVVTDRSWARRALGVATTSGHPGIARIIWDEGIRKKA
jgi:putative NADH-flavin reductase